MIIDLNKKEQELLITELEKSTIPELRGLISHGMKKESRDELKADEVVLKELLEKLKKAA